MSDHVIRLDWIKLEVLNEGEPNEMWTVWDKERNKGVGVSTTHEGVWKLIEDYLKVREQ